MTTSQTTHTDAFKSLFDEALDRYLHQQRQRAERFDRAYQQLWDALAKVSRGGKRIRPILVHEAYRAFGGTDTNIPVTIGLAYELLHTAFVIHDDIIDGDTVRRGQPNMVGLFTGYAAEDGIDETQAVHWATASALIGGDLLLSQAQRLLGGVPLGQETREQLLDQFDESLFITAAGEQADVTYSVQRPERHSLDQVLLMSEHKTANYSFAAPLMAGALAAGATAECVQVLGEIGRLSGIAFQLRDDYLGVFGDTAVTGKSVESDLRSGKTTPLMMFARGTSAWPELAALAGAGPLDEQQRTRAIQVLSTCGARTFLTDLIAQYTQQATLLSMDPVLPPGLGDRLRNTMSALAERNH